MKNEITFHFLKPGLLTQVQDQGRAGYQAFGVPVGGAMDKSSARTANWLVGNPAGNPVLEITVIGPKIEVGQTCQIALTGADLSPEIDGTPIPMFESIIVQQGSTISFGKIKNGCRSYLAIRGGWATKKWLGSCSASANNSPGLTPDSLFQKGGSLKVSGKPPLPKRTAPPETRTTYSNYCKVRVTEGPEYDKFSVRTIGHFFSKSYKITPDSNRMGYRLATELIDFRPGREVISSATLPGTIQITNSGQPILLMVDAQTTGGYLRLANVISADLDKLGQAKPGDEIRFCLVSLEEAKLALEKAREQFAFQNIL